MDYNKILNNKILKVKPSAIRAFNDEAKKLGANIILTLGEPDFHTPDVIKNACIKALNENQTKYGSTPGSLDLRKSISEFEKKKNNVSYDPSEILVTNGSTEALTASLFTILNPGDEVIVPTPCYALYRPVIEYTGAIMKCLDTTENDFQISFEMINNMITDKTKAIILTSPNNPTGCIYNDNSLENVYNAVKDKDIFVIEDACYEQIRYDEYKPGFSKYTDIKEKIIVCQSFSKPYAMPGWRIGYLLADANLIPYITKIHQYMIVCENTFIQPAAIEALKFDVSDFVNDFKKRRDYIYDRINKMGLECVKPMGAFYIFPSIKKFNMSSYDFCIELAKKKKVALVPGSCFECDTNIRISYCVDMNTIIKAMDLLEEFINEL